MLCQPPSECSSTPAWPLCPSLSADAPQAHTRVRRPGILTTTTDPATTMDRATTSPARSFLSQYLAKVGTKNTSITNTTGGRKSSESTKAHKKSATKAMHRKSAKSATSMRIVGDAHATRFSPHISPPFLARVSRRRPDGAHEPQGGAGVADTTSSRLQGVRPVRASASAAAAGGW